MDTSDPSAIGATAAAADPASAAPEPVPPAAPNIRLSRILVPVDFSVSSRKALQYALAFAHQFGARLLVVHVLELSYLGTGLGEIEVPLLENELRENALEHLEKLMTAVVRGTVPCEAQVLGGRPWEEIGGLAKAQEIDLIIMGTHGYTGLKHVVMGSTAERVVRHAPCPVLVVRELEHEFV
jgi:nucleotide-binding universal stress UspA family protein